jgi:hypothetical protein
MDGRAYALPVTELIGCGQGGQPDLPERGNGRVPARARSPAGAQVPAARRVRPAQPGPQGRGYRVRRAERRLEQPAQAVGMGLDLLRWPGLERVDRHRHRPRIRDVDDGGTDRWVTDHLDRNHLE